VIIAW